MRTLLNESKVDCICRKESKLTKQLVEKEEQERIAMGGVAGATANLNHKSCIVCAGQEGSHCINKTYIV